MSPHQLWRISGALGRRAGSGNDKGANVKLKAKERKRIKEKKGKEAEEGEKKIGPMQTLTVKN